MTIASAAPAAPPMKLGYATSVSKPISAVILLLSCHLSVQACNAVEQILTAYNWCCSPGLFGVGSKAASEENEVVSCQNSLEKHPKVKQQT